MVAEGLAEEEKGELFNGVLIFSFAWQSSSDLLHAHVHIVNTTVQYI